MFETDLYDNTRLLIDFVLNKRRFTEDKVAFLNEMSRYVEAMKSPTPKAREFMESCPTPLTYWHQVGSTKFPTLYEVAKVVYNIPTSQAASERVWSIYDLILTKRRTRLKPEKVAMLVQLYINTEFTARDSTIDVLLGMESDDGGSDADDVDSD